MSDKEVNENYEFGRRDIPATEIAEMDEEALSESRESETFDEEDEYSSEEDSEDSASSDEESASNDEESASSEEDAEDHIHPHAPGAHQPNSAPPGTFRLCEHNFGSNTASSDFDWDGDPSTLAVSNNLKFNFISVSQ
ncbi:hypothetical protein PtA15_4A743 [Puccinia triticina]|uniref:Uncharacterized protein n=1 Tax=Puccinia triticina TaxID=208348 RepID=A0ABY7CKF9_9BASI|nr:uncharacterized protein PtA15_4A743 [Puccinia triticina]WAQ84290.1 hypothetical protein PtA15_4A743 [Puccinia triticina]